MPRYFEGSRELKQLRYDDDHNDDFKKTNRFNDQNNSSAHASRFLVHFFVCSFFVFPLHDYVVKPPNLKSYG